MPKIGWPVTMRGTSMLRVGWPMMRKVFGSFSLRLLRSGTGTAAAWVASAP